MNVHNVGPREEAMLRAVPCREGQQLSSSLGEFWERPSTALSPHLKAELFCLLPTEQQLQEPATKEARYCGGHQLSTSVKDRKQPFPVRDATRFGAEGVLFPPEPLTPPGTALSLLGEQRRAEGCAEELQSHSSHFCTPVLVGLWEGDGERKAGTEPPPPHIPFGFPVSCYTVTRQECEIEVDSEYISRALRWSSDDSLHLQGQQWERTAAALHPTPTPRKVKAHGNDYQQKPTNIPFSQRSAAQRQRMFMSRSQRIWR